MAQRFSHHPGVILWHLSNEYEGACYCHQCQAAFRRWLKEKYGTLDNLNHAWWSQVYPVCCAALYPAEQDNGSPQIVPHMVVIVTDPFAQIVNIQILFFSVLDYLTEEELSLIHI